MLKLIPAPPARFRVRAGRARTRRRRIRQAFATPRERIQRAAGCDQIEEIAARDRVEITAARAACRRPPGAVSAAIVFGPSSAGLIAHCAVTLLHRRSAASRSSACGRSRGASPVAGQRQPADAITAGEMHLRQAAELTHGTSPASGASGTNVRAVVKHAVVDLVAQQHQAVPRGDRDQALAAARADTPRRSDCSD